VIRVPGQAFAPSAQSALRPRVARVRARRAYRVGNTLGQAVPSLETLKPSLDLGLRPRARIESHPAGRLQAIAPVKYSYRVLHATRPSPPQPKASIPRRMSRRLDTARLTIHGCGPLLRTHAGGRLTQGRPRIERRHPEIGYTIGAVRALPHVTDIRPRESRELAPHSSAKGELAATTLAALATGAEIAFGCLPVKSLPRSRGVIRSRITFVFRTQTAAAGQSRRRMWIR